MPAVKVDIREAVHKIRKEFRDLTTKQLNQGVARALNRVGSKARTTAIREIRTRYKIKAKDLRGTQKKQAGIRLKKASQKTLTAIVIGSGSPLDLRGFSPRQTKRGVSVNIMGTRVLVKGAFIATMPSGYRGVFARGSYGKGGFNPRKGPGPKAGIKPGKGYTDLGITKLVGVSVPAVFGNDKITSILAKEIEKDFPDRLRHELTYIKFGR